HGGFAWPLRALVGLAVRVLRGDDWRSGATQAPARCVLAADRACDDRRVSDTAPFPTRTFGVLLHPSSLPGPEPIGTFGVEAEEWFDWLSTTGAAVWQVLPLSINGRDESPYFSTSASATNHWLIDLRDLAGAGLRGPLESAPTAAAGPVDFVAMRAWKLPLL